jgi:hypothetical protein
MEIWGYLWYNTVIAAIRSVIIVAFLYTQKTHEIPKEYYCLCYGVA